MRMKHRFHVTIETMAHDDQPHIDDCLVESIKTAIDGALPRRNVEVEFVETFDSESDEEIRTAALVQDAMDSMEGEEPKSDPLFAKSLKNVMDAWEAMSPAQRYLIGKRILDKIKE